MTFAQNSGIMCTRKQERKRNRRSMNYHSKTTRLKEIFLSDLAGERFGEEGRIPSALHLSRLYAASRNTIRPPALRAESQESRQDHRLPRCIRPLGLGAKRPVGGVVVWGMGVPPIPNS